ncbi:RDD family protein [Luteimonas sp. BDR2-5]|nr:RDD family protein [Luteimonas sp. BDR2-5]
MLRRYAAWSLDAALLALLVVALLHRPLCAGLASVDRAFEALAGTMAASMAAAADSGLPPLALATSWLGDPALHAATGELALALSALLLPAWALFALLSLPYFAGFEGGRWQATPGKRLLGLRVIDDDAAAPGLVRAALRQAAGMLSWLSLNFGHALAALPPRHQALHDRIAGTRVVRVDTAPMPYAARLWLALQPPALFLLLALLMRHVDRVVNTALDATLGL